MWLFVNVWSNFCKCLCKIEGEFKFYEEKQSKNKKSIRDKHSQGLGDKRLQGPGGH